jgi:predicted outer membrane repeat protein
MKRITKFVAAACLCCCVSGAYATDFYVSATGSDENDGSSKETAVLTLHRVNELLMLDVDGVGLDGRHRVFIDGMLNMDNEPTSPNSPGSPDDENLHTGYMPLKGAGNARAGFLFGTVNNWGLVDFYGLNALQEETMPGNTLEKKYLVPVDGFDGMNNGRIFAIAGGDHTFKNLKFTHATDMARDGGNVMWVRNSNVTFINCLFKENYPPQNEKGYLAIDGESRADGKGTNGQAGAIFFLGGELDDVDNPGQKIYKKLIIQDCVFDDNMNRRGGAILHSGGDLEIKNSIFMNHNKNNLTLNATGGFDNHAACLELQNEHTNVMRVNIENSLFYNNAAGSGQQAGAIRYAVGNQPTKTGYSEITINGCNFVNNAAQQGGAIFIRAGRADNDEAGKATLKILNTVFRGNTAGADGGAICMQGTNRVGNELTMVNVTIQENQTSGNAGHGAGIVFMDDEGQSCYVKNWDKKIYNCIFENNIATNGGSNSEMGNDIQYRPSDMGVLDMMNSMVGRAGGGIDFGGFTGDNDLNYYPGGSITADMDPSTTDVELQFNNHPGFYTAAPGGGFDNMDTDPYFGMASAIPAIAYAIPLVDDALARTYGNAQYLADYGLTKDIWGFDFVTDNDQCVVGAAEAKVFDLINASEMTGALVEPTWSYPLSTLTPKVVDPNDPYIIGGGTGIESQSVDATLQFVIAGGTISLATGENATIEVISLSGAVAGTGVGAVSIENLPQGLYIAKAQVGGNIYVQKFVK